MVQEEPATHTSPADPPPGRAARVGRWLVLGLILAAVFALFATGGGRELGQQVRARWGEIDTWVNQHWSLALLLYFLVYVLVTGLSLPVANVLGVGAGVLFGRWVGLALISFASTAGATLAFLGSRYLFRDAVRRRLGERFEAINRNVEREGAFYLFTLRLLVVVPFWMINLAMGLTTLPVRTFWWVSQVGMLPGTFLYVNAGAVTKELTDPRDIFSLPIVLSFALLGLAPLALRQAVLWLGREKPAS